VFEPVLLKEDKAAMIALKSSGKLKEMTKLHPDTFEPYVTVNGRHYAITI